MDSAVAEPTDSSIRPVLGGAFRPAMAAAVAVFAVDQITKAIALDRLTFGSPVDVFWTLDWNLVWNTGSAFSLGTGFGPIIGIASIVIGLVMLFMASRSSSRLVGLLLGAVAGGAYGNVADRLFRVGDCDVGDCSGFMGGAVVDFIDFNWWPVFNVADIFVVAGAILVAVLLMFEDAAGQDPSAAESADEARDKRVRVDSDDGEEAASRDSDDAKPASN